MTQVSPIFMVVILESLFTGRDIKIATTDFTLILSFS